MILTRDYIDDYLFCPMLFGKNTLSDKYSIPKLQNEYSKFKDHVAEIASYEMKNCEKLSLYDYRIKYTNKHYSSSKRLMNNLNDGIINKLNRLFSYFSDNIFIGYNIPIDVAAPGTSAVFRKIYDFGLINTDQTELLFVEIEDLSDELEFKKKLINWPHWYTPNSYLAKTFNKKVIVLYLDPVLDKQIEVAYLPEMFSADIESLSKIVNPISNGVFWKALNSCKDCSLVGECG